MISLPKSSNGSSSNGDEYARLLDFDLADTDLASKVKRDIAVLHSKSIGGADNKMVSMLNMPSRHVGYMPLTPEAAEAGVASNATPEISDTSPKKVRDALMVAGTVATCTAHISVDEARQKSKMVGEVAQELGLRRAFARYPTVSSVRDPRTKSIENGLKVVSTVAMAPSHISFPKLKQKSEVADIANKWLGVLDASGKFPEAFRSGISCPIDEQYIFEQLSFDREMVNKKPKPYEPNIIATYEPRAFMGRKAQGDLAVNSLNAAARENALNNVVVLEDACVGGPAKRALRRPQIMTISSTVDTRSISGQCIVEKEDELSRLEQEEIRLMGELSILKKMQSSSELLSPHRKQSEQATKGQAEATTAHARFSRAAVKIPAQTPINPQEALSIRSSMTDERIANQQFVSTHPTRAKKIALTE
ncbi:MAG: hypothetical protein IT497_06565 [Ottowia sp.]|nr:hypothetical protein [Ottowia sp.]